MNAFEKALLQAADNDFSDVPAEEKLNFKPVSLKKIQKAHTLRRTMIVAAVIVVLVGSALGAYVLSHRLGNVEVETDARKMFHMSIDDGNRYYQITFEENFANADAPDMIKTYFLPTTTVNAENLIAQSCYIAQEGSLSYRPFTAEHTNIALGTHIPTVFLFSTEASSQTEIDRIMNTPTTAHYEWYANGHKISFTQSLAVHAADGTPFVRYAVPDLDTISISYRNIQIDEYEVFSFEQDFSKHADLLDKKNPISRTWYWSDGNYLFELNANLPEAEMRELFFSVKAVSANYPYHLAENNYVDEVFTIPS